MYFWSSQCTKYDVLVTQHSCAYSKQPRDVTESTIRMHDINLTRHMFIMSSTCKLRNRSPGPTDECQTCDYEHALSRCSQTALIQAYSTYVATIKTTNQTLASNQSCTQIEDETPFIPSPIHSHVDPSMHLLILKDTDDPNKHPSYFHPRPRTSMHQSDSFVD